MKYKEITIYTENPEKTAEELSAAGCDQLIINDPKDLEILEKESWGYTGSFVDRCFIDELKKRSSVTFYIGDNESVTDEVRAVVENSNAGVAIVDDEDWLHKWEEYYVPFEITEGIVIKPVFRDYERKGSETVIEIDPGMAFGTGSSPTTYLAAQLLAEYLKPGFSVLDVGCGTGIQSLIAAKLKAKDILAVDYDPEAVSSTKVNAKLNGVSNIEIKRNDLAKGLEFRVDLIAANLTGPLILELCKDIKHVCRPGTILIASGIIEEMEEPCSRAIEDAGFEILKIKRGDCWSAIAASFSL